MALKRDIAKAINADGKYTVVKVWAIDIEGPDVLGSGDFMRIEVEVRKRKKRNKI